MPMIDKNILREKARKYTVCFNGNCPLHEHCLRWQAGLYTPDHLYSISCFNPNHPGACTDTCPGFRSDQPQRIPRGMVHFYEAMPGRMEVAIKSHLITHFSRVMYYRYRRGEYPITPEIEQVILDTCRECGWTAPLVFDSYSEELVW